MGTILALVGPTAVGKTELSLRLAERAGAEIVSCDSRQVFRPLTVGSAKPTPAELARAPHHFIDEKELTEPFSAGRFAEEANARIASIHARGKPALVTGGSTLYLEALAHGLAPIPQTSGLARERLNARIAAGEAAQLFAELQAIDPAAAATMDPTKSQRIARALEVYEETGHTLSSFHERRQPPPHRFTVVVLDRPREELYTRIERRVDEMLRSGLLEENGALLEAGYADDLPALRTIGYQEPRAFLRGDLPYEEMVALLKRNTRRYAKRQLTWFRRRDTYRWVDLSAFRSVAEAADHVAALMRASAA